MHLRIVARLLLLHSRHPKPSIGLGGCAKARLFYYFFDFIASKDDFYHNINPNPLKKNSTNDYPLLSFPPTKHNMRKYIFEDANFFPGSLQSICKKKPSHPLLVLTEEKKRIISLLWNSYRAPISQIYTVSIWFDCESMCIVHYFFSFLYFIEGLIIVLPLQATTNILLPWWHWVPTLYSWPTINLCTQRQTNPMTMNENVNVIGSRLEALHACSPQLLQRGPSSILLLTYAALPQRRKRPRSLCTPKNIMMMRGLPSRSFETHTSLGHHKIGLSLLHLRFARERKLHVIPWIQNHLLSASHIWSLLRS